MMSLRSIARSAPRALSRASLAVARSYSAAPTSRPATAALRTSWSPLRSQVSAFSTSMARRSDNEVDSELSAKLDSEIQFEQDMKDNEPQPASVKDFIDNGGFEVVDTAGQQDVVLKRTYGNETITITFSISDLSQYDDNGMYDEDSTLADEDTDGSNPSGLDKAAQREIDALDEAVAEEDSSDPASSNSRSADSEAVPCRLNIVVEKPSQGALNIEALAQDGSIIVENMYYYKDPAMAHSSSPEATHAAQDVYPGPPFGSLDEDLQVLMERYLEERGITSTLATFVPDYMEMKEQKEYLAWLNNIKGFVDA